VVTIRSNDVSDESGEDPYRPRFVKAPVPARGLPAVDPAGRPSRFEGGVAIVLIALCMALPVGLLIALMFHNGGRP
jgi:hypothetical protein